MYASGEGGKELYAQFLLVTCMYKCFYCVEKEIGLQRFREIRSSVLQDQTSVYIFGLCTRRNRN